MSLRVLAEERRVHRGTRRVPAFSWMFATRLNATASGTKSARPSPPASASSRCRASTTSSNPAASTASTRSAVDSSLHCARSRPRRNSSTCSATTRGRRRLHAAERVERLLDRRGRARGGTRGRAGCGGSRSRRGAGRTGRARPVAFSPTADDADERVEPVRERRRARPRRRGASLRGADRLVVVLDRVRDLGLRPSQPRVVAAHHALQLGELAHHAGVRSAFASRAASTTSATRSFAGRSPRERARDGDDALGPLELGAELAPGTTRPSPRRGRASGRFRSSSKKNRASASRARSTRS